MTCPRKFLVATTAVGQEIYDGLPSRSFMKTHRILILGLMAGVSLGAPRASADLEVSGTIQIHAKAGFEAPLAPYGSWVEVGSYGRCWRPARLSAEWRPYCSGEWVWTDCGWYWASDEPWAWACYHYGWWVYDTNYGWVWVPDIDWAPAWVSWRVGGGFIGWAPLPPPGLLFTHHPNPDLFVFVSAGHFVDPVRPSSVLLKNATVIAKTTEIGGLKRESRSFPGAGSQRVMVNQGPGVEMIQKAAGRTLGAVSIREAVRRTHRPTELKRGAMVPKPRGEWRDSPAQPGPGPDAPGRDHFAPSIDGFGPSAPPGRGHGNGGGHDKGRG
jgi:hypothetical protein